MTIFNLILFIVEAEIFVVLQGVVDLGKEKERLSKDIE